MVRSRSSAAARGATPNAPARRAGGARRGAGPSRRADSGRGRRCVGCGQRVAYEHVRAQLVRLVLVPQREGCRVVVDLAGSAQGRGAWVHPTDRCLRQAARRGLAAAAGARVNVDLRELAHDISLAAGRRLDGLVMSARRSRRLAVGSAAMARAWREGRAKLIVLARDATACSRLKEVQQAVRHGVVHCWGDKAHWASLLRGERGEVGVMAIECASIAEAVKQTVALAHSVDAGARQSRAAGDAAGRPTDGRGSVARADGGVCPHAVRVGGRGAGTEQARFRTE